MELPSGEGGNLESDILESDGLKSDGLRKLVMEYVNSSTETFAVYAHRSWARHARLCSSARLENPLYDRFVLRRSSREAFQQWLARSWNYFSPWGLWIAPPRSVLNAQRSPGEVQDMFFFVRIHGHVHWRTV